MWKYNWHLETIFFYDCVVNEKDSVEIGLSKVKQFTLLLTSV